MSLELIIPGTNATDIKDHLPATYCGPVLQGALVRSLYKCNTEIILQELFYPDFYIRFISGNTASVIEAKNWNDGEGLHSCFMLKNNIHKKINKLGSVHLCKDHHVLSYGNNASCKGIIEQPHSFEILDIFYSRKILEQLTDNFPALSPIIETRGNHIIGDRAFWTPPGLREIYNQILDCPFDKSHQLLYFELKVREILLHILKDGLNRNSKEPQFTPYEAARIHEAKEILETYIDKKPPTVRELSKMVAINEFKLKMGFRKFFNTSIFNLVTSLKMHRAKHLIQESSKPIKEIAAISGYPRTTNFITAFRKKFGITPGEIRGS